MFVKSRCLAQALRSALLAALWASGPMALAGTELRVCADPENLPFSNRQQQGFENKIAALLATDLHATLRYTWMKQRQNFFGQTLGAHRCDVVMGVPEGFDRVLSSRPYYRSSYVLVTAKRRHLDIKSFDDPVLRSLKIGLHTIGGDGSNAPPAVALSRRGIVNNIVGFSLWGEGSAKDPQGQIIDAVAKGDIDVAMVWGPLGGYFAKKYGDALAVTPAPADAGMPDLSFAFSMVLGVRKDDAGLAAKLESSLERNRSKVQAVLAAYHVPLIEPDTGLAAPPLGSGPAEPQLDTKR
jgi:mxaJ protein